MPSRFEGLGMVALEAQAAGTPVVGFDVDGLRDAVGVGGVLVPAGDLAALRGAVDGLLRTPTRRKEAGARGRQVVLAEHSWDAIASASRGDLRGRLSDAGFGGVAHATRLDVCPLSSCSRPSHPPVISLLRSQRSIAG